MTYRYNDLLILLFQFSVIDKEFDIKTKNVQVKKILKI